MTTPSPPGPDVSSALTKARHRLLPFLFLLYVVAYLDRVNVGFAALQMKSSSLVSAHVDGSRAS